MKLTPSRPPQPPVLFAVIAYLFGFMGVTAIVFLWASSLNSHHPPPIPFRVFGTFIGLAFFAMGFGIPIRTFLHRASQAQDAAHNSANRNPLPSTSGYQCPGCGAKLQDEEVSPRGDVKCNYCRKWWNIHHS